MKAFLRLLLLLFFFTTKGTTLQALPIGHTTITFNDPTRTGGFGSGGGAGRQIQCEIYYPGTTAGDNVPVANGTFPIIVVGHGFFMSWDAYTNIWEHYVNTGYILVFPRTEGSLSPTHAEFGMDLRIVGEKMQATTLDNVSLFYNKWNGKTALMGHSMGGGATFLAAGVSNPFDAIVGLAPAETTPSAITAAATVTTPTLIFSGTEDGVTPPTDHHIPIYNALPNSICKQFVAITGGAHCYFANSNAACDFGESTSGGNISITRAEQHAIMFDLLDPWLSFYLKGVCSDWVVFTNLLTTDNRIVGQSNCSYQLPSAATITANGSVLSISSSLTIQWNLNGNPLSGENATSIETANHGDGSYTVTITDENGCSATSIPVNIQGGNVGINEVNSFIYEFYPNPATTELNITSNSTMPIELKLMNTLGQLIEVRSFSGNTVWNIEQLNAGVYYLQTAIGSQRRFIKQ